MKRFYAQAAAEQAGDGWQVALDRRRLKTQGGRAQALPTRALAEALAAEWADQGETIDPEGFVLRDLADHAIDAVAPDPAATIATLLRFAEGDTLCYRAPPGDPLAPRQEAVWEPLLEAAEARLGVQFVRAAGVIHQPQPAATLARLEGELTGRDAFTLAALAALASLAASLVIALAAIAPGSDAEALWNAANLEEDWQAEHWGHDAEAAARRERRRQSFLAAARFAVLARAGL